MKNGNLMIAAFAVLMAANSVARAGTGCADLDLSKLTAVQSINFDTAGGYYEGNDPIAVPVPGKPALVNASGAEPQPAAGSDAAAAQKQLKMNAQRKFVCGNEAQVARAQASSLRDAAALCRQDIADGSNCTVTAARWHATLTVDDAEDLAARLQKYAIEMERLDRKLQDRIDQFTVPISNSTPSSVDVRCSNVAVTLKGDRVTDCLYCCYRKYGIPVLDALAGDIREMLPLFASNFASLAGCNNMCVTTTSACGERPNKDWWNPGTPLPPIPPPSKPECVSCPDGYHCNPAKNGCSPDKKPDTQHPA